MKKNSLPPGWDLERVNRILDRYQLQEGNKSFAHQIMGNDRQASNKMEIPQELVPVVQELIDKYQAA